ncbi:MAG: hypothetical protein M3N49_01300 [Candidatus Eremiobacteraeota bacterium]|nr:hypothetical protein [Candidatus Eremiobacteraeota bacterium]
MTGDVLAEIMLAESKFHNQTHHHALLDRAPNYMARYIKPVGAVNVAEILTRALAGLPSVCTGPPPRPRVVSPIGPVGLDLGTADSRDVYLATRDTYYFATFLVCKQYPKRHGERDVVWRVKENLGIGPNDPRHPLDNLNPDDDGNAALVVVEQSLDLHFGFMAHPETWPRSLKDPQRDDSWLLIELSRPRFETVPDFWRLLTGKFKDRIVVVLTAEDLRLAGMRISRSLSWDATFADLYDQIEKLWNTVPKDRSPLHGCASLVVSFGSSGAAIFMRENNTIRARLIYDPVCGEEDWLKHFDGTMNAFTRCFTAGVALEMIRCRGKDMVLDGRGAKAGIVAARRLIENGFEPFGKYGPDDTELPRDLRFPSTAIAAVLRSALASPGVIDDLANEAEDLRATLSGRDVRTIEDVVDAVRAKIRQPDIDFGVLEYEVCRIYGDWDKVVERDFDATGGKAKNAAEREEYRKREKPRLVDRILRFVAPDRPAIAAAKALQDVSAPTNDVPESVENPFGGWSILSSKYPTGEEDRAAAKKILKLCREVVEYGSPQTPFTFPSAKIGLLHVTNREEQESLFRARELMIDYVNSTASTPLCMAVFGSPGSGKSFAIQQLAMNIERGRYSGIQIRTFNLAQFTRHEALAVALQQVRDDGLAGKMPLVFWDEFDTQYEGGLGWLRSFLAPMQDGKYQDGSALYYVGRAIFFFAGGTHETMDHFIVDAKTADGSDYNPIARKFKVPDFVSRLKGYVNIAPLDYRTARDDPNSPVVIDAATALRRAKLLRVFLEQSPGDLEETVPLKVGGKAAVMRKRLSVDPGVVAAFLSVKSFGFGARSMEAIVKMSALSGKSRYDRSSLPPDDQLALHVNAQAFLRVANRGWAE